MCISYCNIILEKILLKIENHNFMIVHQTFVF